MGRGGPAARHAHPERREEVLAGECCWRGGGATLVKAPADADAVHRAVAAAADPGLRECNQDAYSGGLEAFRAIQLYIWTIVPAIVQSDSTVYLDNRACDTAVLLPARRTIYPACMAQC